MRRTRGLAVSFTVRRKLAAATVSHTAAAERLAVSRQRFEKLLDDGLLQWGDVEALEDLAPGLIAALLGGRFRVAPAVARGRVEDIVTAVAQVLARVGELTTETMVALADGITPSSAAAVSRAVQKTIAELNELEAAVGTATASGLRRVQ